MNVREIHIIIYVFILADFLQFKTITFEIH